MQPLVQLFIAAGVSVLFAGLVIAGANALRSDPETVASPSPTTVGDLASLLEEARAIDEAAEPGVGVISIPGESVTSADPDRPGRGSGPDSSGPDGSGPDGSGPDGSGPDGSGPDGSGPDGSGPDGSGPDGNGVDGSVPGGSTPGGTGPDGGSNPTDPGSSVVPPGEPPGATTPVPGPGSTDPPVARPTDPPSTPAPIGERCGVGGAGGFAEDRRIELDLDGDANADVVQISAPGAGGARTVRVSLGEGSSFSSPLPVPAALDGGDPLRTLAAFDVDVDGDLEVAIRSDRGDEDGTWYLDLDECTPVASRLVNESSGAFGDLVLYERADQGGLSEFGCTTPGDGAPRIVSRSIVLQFDDTGTSTGSTVETTTIDRRSLSTAGTTQTQYRPSEEIPPAPPPCR